MNRLATTGVVVLVAAQSLLAGQAGQWYPSRWRVGDQRGAANRLTTAKVLEAVRLVKTGVTYELGRVYEAGMPLLGPRHFSLRIPQAFGPQGTNHFLYHDDLVSTELGQVGTQLDGLGHVGIGDLFYNGNDRATFAKPEGLTRLGIENVGPMVTRGVLIDVAGFKGTAMLAGGYEVTAADLKGALERENVQIHPGDVVLIHTGWGALWMVDNPRYLRSAPGIGIAAAQFLVDAEVVVVGADTWNVEVAPSADASQVGPVHQLLLTRNGIYLHENLLTEWLAHDGTYEFAYVFTPLRLKGATGSPGSPIAIR
jgi:kynurenine formamidase